HLRVEKTGEHDLGQEPGGPPRTQGVGDGAGGAQDPDESLLSGLLERHNNRHGTDFTEKDFAKPFQKTIEAPGVRQAAVANDNVDNFGVVFDEKLEDNMAEHIDTIANLGKQYFAPDKSFKHSLNRSARAAAWRMIRAQEGV